MSVSGSVGQALDELRAVFPLEARVAALDEATRRAYGQVLRHWCERRIAPRRDSCDRQAVDRLIEIDAVVDIEGELGCYPFSVRATDHRVRLDDGDVEAMCAVDALAIPSVLERQATVHSHCHVCGAPLAVAMSAAGGARPRDPAQVSVHVRLAGPGDGSSCSRTLCRNLRFACAGCEAPNGLTALALGDGVELGRAFFAFQQRVLAV